MRIPDHIRWPGLVVAILGLSVTANIVLVMAARSDGGAQVEPDYYRKAVAWDARQDLLDRSAALRWDMHLTVSGASEASVITVTVLDRDGAPIPNLEASVSVHHAAESEVRTVALAPIDGQPGVYRGQGALARPGLWDFDVALAQGETRFLAQVRQELAAAAVR